MDVPRSILPQLGWRRFFTEQLSAEESRCFAPVRVMSVHRGMVEVLGDDVDGAIPSSVPAPRGAEDRPTVGDWLLIDRSSRTVVRILDRISLLKRPDPGDERRVQLIAANIDTLFIVSSCDQDFNIARLERYLVLAREAGIRPIIVLTKADLSPDRAGFMAKARDLQPGLQVAVVNGRDPDSVAALADHCPVGETVGLVGSSGVGKSTLINTLTGSDSILTQAVREGDGKGLHTTTVRQMHRLGGGPGGGGWLVDTPGMRELQMAEVLSGVAEVFDDILEIARDCRFANCTHQQEPGCAIRAAIGQGTLLPDRVERWRKLTEEAVLNTGKAALRRDRQGKTGRRT